MKFLNEELNERIELFASGNFKRIIGEEKHPCYKLLDLRGESLSCFSRFDVEYHGVIYECVFTPSKQKELYVFLSGATPRSNDLRANFDRVSWHQFFNGCCINIEDPTYKKQHVKSGWGGYFGDRQISYIDGVEAIVKKIQFEFDIPNINVFFISSSAGGFASLHVCVRNDGYKCLVMNPQIFLGKKELGMIGSLSNMDFSELQYKERLDLGNRIVSNKTSTFFMMFNRCSDWDMGNLKQLLTKFGVYDVTRNYYQFGNKHIIVMETDIKDPHGNHSGPFPITVFIRLALYPLDDMEHMILSFLKANQERLGWQDKVREQADLIINLRQQMQRSIIRNRHLTDDAIYKLLRIKWWEWRIDKLKTQMDDFESDYFIDKHYEEVLGQIDLKKNENIARDGMLVTAVEAVVKTSSVNMMECVNYFEGGNVNIYLLAESGGYSGRAAVRGRNSIVSNGRGGWSLKFEQIPSIVCDKPIDQVNLKDLMAVRENAFEDQKLKELPIVDSQGHLCAVAKEPVTGRRMLTDWQALKVWPKSLPQGKLYVSSLQSPLLKAFWKVWNGRLDMELMSNQNYQEVFNGGTGMLIYENDVFPAIKKMSIWELGWRFEACLK